jgi:hypothetical protein
MTEMIQDMLLSRDLDITATEVNWDISINHRACLLKNWNIVGVLVPTFLTFLAAVVMHWRRSIRNVDAVKVRHMSQNCKMNNFRCKAQLKIEAHVR